MAADFAGFEAGLAADLEAIFEEGGGGVTPADKAGEIASAISTRLAAWLLTVTVNPGIPVATAGSATAQTGATTGPGTLL